MTDKKHYPPVYPGDRKGTYIRLTKREEIYLRWVELDYRFDNLKTFFNFMRLPDANLGDKFKLYE